MISVVVPVYNVQKYIARCMDSLVGQTFQGPYEIIVIDDGSTDDSIKIVEEYQKSYSNILVHHQENGGLSVARNKGVQLATGKYIIFVDSDDSLRLDALQLLYDEMAENDLDLVIFEHKGIYEEECSGEEISKNQNITMHQIMPGEAVLERIGLELITEYNASACRYMIRRNILLNYQLTFYPSILHEDELFTPQLLYVCQRIKHIDEFLYMRYIHAGSIMTSANVARKMNGLYTVILNLIDWKNQIEAKKELDRAIRKIIQIHYQNYFRFYYSDKQLQTEKKEQADKLRKTAKANKIHMSIMVRLFLLKEILS